MKSLSFFLYGVLILSFISSCKKEILEPNDLLCEFQANPKSVENVTPRFSWKLNDTLKESSQEAYQVLVASDIKILNKDKADIWNSGKVESEQSHLVNYLGKELVSGKKYYWKVRIWNQNGVKSKYSEFASFEMGMLNDKYWHAEWIGQDIQSISKTSDILGNWIWLSGNQGKNKEIYFRKNFFLPEKKIQKAILRVTADNNFSVYLNGRYIAQASDWRQFYTHEISTYLNPDYNTLSFTVNKGNNSKVAGLIFSIHLFFEGGSEQIIVSDETTLATAKTPKGEWKEISFDDDGWSNSGIVAPFGSGVWKDSVKLLEPRNSVMLRKEFYLSKPIESAKIYVTGLGGYKLSMNGNKVGKDLLTPGWTHYPKKVQYQVYDVTEDLKLGGNVIGALLGNIWWSSGLGWNGGSYYSDKPLRFLAQLEINYKDGTSDEIITNATWKSDYSPIIYNSLYHGENYDARLEQEGWDESNFDDNNWQFVKIFEDLTPKKIAQYSPAIQVTDTLTAESVTEPKPGVFVFDFGQNMVGREKLRISGKEGQKIIMRFAELLSEDGTVAQENLRMAKATDVYTCRGVDEEVWSPDFVYHGFRYVQVEGLEEKPSKDLLLGEVFHTNADFIGKFESSNNLLNQIWTNITWGQRGNMMSVPTDCPQRDERLGWMGDAQIFAPTANYNMNMSNFWAKWVADIVDCQTPEGWVYDVNPAIVVDGPSKPGWGDAVVVTPWMSYLYYGDKKILEDNYQGMKAWVEYMREKSDDNIYEWGDGDWGGYGDWVAVEASPTKPIGDIYYYYSTKLLAKIAKILNKDLDAKEYEELLPEIVEAFQEKYFNPEISQYIGETQTANLLPLAIGITPEDLQDDVFENIVTDVLEHDKHLTTGFLGTAYLLPELTKRGQHELAYELAITETYPSWGYMVKNGATTMWELWNSDKEKPEGMNSRNHFAYGSVGEWYFGYLAGIRPMEEHPGFKKIIIQPYIPENLENAGASYKSPYGKIESYWKKTKEGLELSVLIPPNTSAEVYLPFTGYNKIIEGETTLYDNGKTFESGNSIFLGRKGDYLAFDILAGKYTFYLNQ